MKQEEQSWLKIKIIYTGGIWFTKNSSPVCFLQLIKIPNRDLAFWKLSLNVLNLNYERRHHEKKLFSAQAIHVRLSRMQLKWGILNDRFIKSCCFGHNPLCSRSAQQTQLRSQTTDIWSVQDYMPARWYLTRIEHLLSVLRCLRKTECLLFCTLQTLGTI